MLATSRLIRSPIRLLSRFGRRKELEHPLMRNIQYLDELVDELAKGSALAPKSSRYTSGCSEGLCPYRLRSNEDCT
jgi:hypothetical protein